MKINEIFTSIQGETSFAGLPFTFIRLTGCNLRCSYCDTQYAYDEGSEFTIHEVLEEVERREIRRVVITGGEPLLQDETYPLSVSLIEKGFSVLLETNGSKPVKDIDRRVHKILDLKCPGSEMSSYMDFRNVSYLTLRDEIKFVVSDWEDFRWAVEVMKEYNLAGKSHILFSPAFNRLSPKTLAEWIIREKLNVRLQLQTHRYIWPDIMRGV